ncbi:MAG: hypothetical protein IIA40_07750 [SAR324 cluster bacterium]|nr:hypothetical protein [SAR324 cluster bacterium]
MTLRDPRSFSRIPADGIHPWNSAGTNTGRANLNAKFMTSGDAMAADPDTAMTVAKR